MPVSFIEYRRLNSKKMITNEEKAILDQIAPSLSFYLRSGNLSPFFQKIDPNLNVDDIARLLRIHFVLTKKNDYRKFDGVIDFVRKLQDGIHRIKTTSKYDNYVCHGESVGRINHLETMKKRCFSNKSDRTLIVLVQAEKMYKIPENLVLKKLLSIIYDVVHNDLSAVLDKKYEWLKGWWESEQKLKSALEDLYKKNIYLKRIGDVDENISPRMLSRALNSRIALYREAALLLSEYIQLMNYDINPDMAKDILRNTFIMPEKTEVLFELYWTIRIIKQFDSQAEDMSFKILEPGSGNVVAKWKSNDCEYRLYHNSTGSLKFAESTEKHNELLTNKENYFGRRLKVFEKLDKLIEGSQSMWRGRPDIVLEKRNKDNKWKTVLIGEVKYTHDKYYALRGLRQLLEYIAFAKYDDVYAETYDNLFSESTTIKGCLFTLKVRDLEIPDDPAIQVVMFGEEKQIIF